MSKQIESQTDKNEVAFYAEISELLSKARVRTYQAVNTIMVQTYWQIGRRIVEPEQHGKSRAGYGDYLITNLSRHLSGTFGKGFSEANLWNMKQFYQTFPDFDQFSTQCVANLSWTNIRLIMRFEDDNPTIGIILCAEKDETIVKYSVLKENKQLFASKYKTVLPTEEELATMITQRKRKLIESKIENE